MKMKRTFFLISLLSSPLLHSYTDWQFWNVSSINCPLGKKSSLNLEKKSQFTNSMKNFSYIYIEPSLQFALNKYHTVSLDYRIKWDKSNEKWNNEKLISISYLLKNLFSPLDVYGRAKLYNRHTATVKNYAALRIRPGINLIKNKYITLYVQNEFFYNHYNYQNFDRNRFTIGIRRPLFGPLQTSLYYSCQKERKEKSARETISHIIGIDLNLKL